jgi:hypothetical protein
MLPLSFCSHAHFSCQEVVNTEMWYVCVTCGRSDFSTQGSLKQHRLNNKACKAKRERELGISSPCIPANGDFSRVVTSMGKRLLLTKRRIIHRILIYLPPLSMIVQTILRVPILVFSSNSVSLLMAMIPKSRKPGDHLIGGTRALSVS